MVFDKKILIYNYTLSKNTYGETEGALVLHTWTFAKVNYKGGREGFYARQVVATGNVVFKMRYIPGITEKMFIEYNEKMYNIRHIAEDGRKRFLEITAEMHDNMSVPAETEEETEEE